MKKIISEADKTDMPLESNKRVLTRTTTATNTNKSKISVISSKKTSTTAPKTGAKTTRRTSAKTSTSKTKTATSSKPKTIVKIGSKSQSDQKVKSQADLRAKLRNNSVDNIELEKLNEAKIKSRGYRGKRNGFIIIILSVLLAIAITAIVLMVAFRKKETNCTLKVRGDASAVYLVNGEELSEFKSPYQIQANRVLRLDVDLKIESSGEYYVEFAVEIYQGSLLLSGIQLLGADTLMFEMASDGMTYRSRGVVDGNQTIQLFTGIAIDSTNAEGLNDMNFRMEVITTFRRA